jgi:hypothetical protein
MDKIIPSGGHRCHYFPRGDVSAVGVSDSSASVGLGYLYLVQCNPEMRDTWQQKKFHKGDPEKEEGQARTTRPMI